MAITVVQSAVGNGQGSITFPNPTTNGNCILAFFGGFVPGNTPTVSSVSLTGTTDNFTNNVSKSDTTNGGIATIWSDLNCSSAKTIVASTSGLAVGGIASYAYELSGILTAGALDRHTSQVKSTTTWDSGTTSTTTGFVEAWVGFAVSYNAGTPTISGPSSPWTNLASDSVTNSIGISGYQLVTNLGAADYSGTCSFGQSTIAVIATFKGTYSSGSSSPSGAGAVVSTGGIAGISGITGAGAFTPGPFIVSYQASSFAGSGSSSSNVTLQSSSSSLGASSLSTVSEGPSGVASISGSGVLSASGRNVGISPITGAGSLTASGSVAGTTQGFASFSGAGSVTIVSSIKSSSSLIGQGTATNSNIINLITANLAGTGTATPNSFFAGFSSIIGLGSVNGIGKSAFPRMLSVISKWMVRDSVAIRPASLYWRALQAVNITQNCSWYLKQRAYISPRFRYNIFNQRTRLTNIGWNINGVLISLNSLFSWTTLSNVKRFVVSGWNNRYSALASSSRIYWQTNISGTPISKNAKWNVYIPVSRAAFFTFGTKKKVSISSSIKWNTRNAVQKSYYSRWQLRVTSAANASSSWNYVNIVSLSANLTWNIDTAIRIIDYLRWNVVGRPLIGRVSLWNTLVDDNLSATIEWNVGTVPQSAIVQTALNDIFFSYPGT